MAVFVSQLVGAALVGMLLFVSLATFAFMLIRLKPYEEDFRRIAEGQAVPAKYDGNEAVVRRRAKDAETK